MPKQSKKKQTTVTSIKPSPGLAIFGTEGDEDDEINETRTILELTKSRSQNKGKKGKNSQQQQQQQQQKNKHQSPATLSDGGGGINKKQKTRKRSTDKAKRAAGFINDGSVGEGVDNDFLMGNDKDNNDQYSASIMNAKGGATSSTFRLSDKVQNIPDEYTLPMIRQELSKRMNFNRTQLHNVIKKSHNEYKEIARDIKANIREQFPVLHDCETLIGNQQKIKKMSKILTKKLADQFSHVRQDKTVKRLDELENKIFKYNQRQHELEEEEEQKSQSEDDDNNNDKRDDSSIDNSSDDEDSDIRLRKKKKPFKKRFVEEEMVNYVLLLLEMSADQSMELLKQCSMLENYLNDNENKIIELQRELINLEMGAKTDISNLAGKPAFVMQHHPQYDQMKNLFLNPIMIFSEQNFQQHRVMS